MLKTKSKSPTVLLPSAAVAVRRVLQRLRARPEADGVGRPGNSGAVECLNGLIRGLAWKCGNFLGQAQAVFQ
jgi:hypothetical protein